MDDARVTQVVQFLRAFQNNLCRKIESYEPSERFIEDPWQRPEGGGGLTCVLSNGQVIEKAGVNFSHIKGSQLPLGATLRRPELVGCQFQAMGISLIIHPLNPHAPTTHLNLRFFTASKPQQAPIWWFGGGFDLTPYYLYAEDCAHWHRSAHQACQTYGEARYQQYKKWCDEYFYLTHRQEARGIGGLFFDDLNEDSFEQCFAFVRSIAQGFEQAYWPILNRRHTLSYSQAEREFQLYRRGRYVEFNLLHDRGTLFGLQSNGRIESILVSMPPLVSWRYDWQPSPNSPEAALYSYLKAPHDWLKNPLGDPLDPLDQAILERS